MNLRFTGRHVGVPLEDREYAEAKLQALSRYHRRLTDLEVCVEMDGSTLERVEIAARFGRNRSLAVGEDAVFRVALDRAIDALRRQIQKSKEKVVTRRRRAKSPARGGPRR
jgi:ribosomal subunit interface protein